MDSNGHNKKDVALQAACVRSTLASRGLAEGQSHGETALILFTLFLPTSLGIAYSSFLFDSLLVSVLVVFIVATIGMLASIAHLAKPFRAPYAILHWKTSWLSREILAVSAYWGLCLIWLILAVFGQAQVALAAHIVVILFGFVLMVVVGRAYMTHARPAWNGYENILELLSVVFGLGFSAGAFLGAFSAHPLSFFPSLFCTCMLFFGVVLFTLAHNIRLKRLFRSFAEEGSFKTKVDLENYKNHQSKIRVIQAFQLLAFLIALMSTFFTVPPFFTALWLCVLLAEVIAQVIARHLFYSLSIQVKHVPLWRGGQEDV